MKRLFRKIHLWLALPFGLIIIVICLTGAILIFEKEITQLVRWEAFHLEEGDAEALPIGDLIYKVQKSLNDERKVRSVTVTNHPRHAYTVSFPQPRWNSYYVNQYTGEVICEAGKLPFFGYVMRLHRWLLDSAKPDGGVFWGRIIVGVSTIAFILSMIAGVIIWWPKNWRMLKRRFKIRTRLGRNLFWFDLHNTSGAVSFLVLVAMGLTGLNWSFSGYRKGFLALLGFKPGEVEWRGRRGQGHGARRNRAMQDETYLSWERALEEFRTKHPDVEKDVMVSKGVLSVQSSKLGNIRASDQYFFDERSGLLTSARLARDLPRAEGIKGWIYSVHTFSFLGLVGKIIGFAAVVLGVVVVCSGYVMWWNRVARHKK